MQVSFTKSYAAAKYARLLIFAPQPRPLPDVEKVLDRGAVR
jgi:hypothetical protein